MENLHEFLAAVASHWLLLSLAAGALLAVQFGRFDSDNKIVQALIIFALGCIILALYLTVSEPLAGISRPH